MIMKQNKKRYIITLVICMLINIIALVFIDPSKRMIPISMIVIILGLLAIQLTRREE